MRLIQQLGQMSPVAGLLLGGLAVRMLIAAGLPVGWDEAYYYLYTQHLDWSYFDHPVMVALTTGLGIWLTGWATPFTLRIGALVLYTGSLWLLYLTGRHLFGQRAARLTLAIATLTPLFMLGFGVLTSPDNGLVWFGTLTLYVAAQEFFLPADLVGQSLRRHQTYRPTARIAGVGILLGLACLSKYHGFLLGLGLVGFCAASPPYRRALRSPWLALGLLLFVLTLLPLWLWNANHDWISFRFHLGLRFDSGGPPQFSLLRLLGVIGMEVGLLFPAIGFPLWWVSLRGAWQQLRWAAGWADAGAGFYHRQGFVLWMGLPIMLGFTVLGGAQHMAPAWPAPGFWVMTLWLGYRAAHWSQRSVRRWLGWSGGIIGLLLLFVWLHLTLGTLQKPGGVLGGVLTPQQDPVNELIDATQLRRRLAEDPTIVQALKAADFIFTNEYFLGGYLDMAVRPLTAAPVTSLTQDPRGFAIWYPPEQWLGKNGIFITIGRHTQQQELVNRYRNDFATFEKLGQVSTQRHGVATETFYLYRADRMLRPYRYPYP
jgi:4-amino-4-deoxy-L-arabinose transferase-like glycosyltransferase